MMRIGRKLVGGVAVAILAAMLGHTALAQPGGIAPRFAPPGEPIARPSFGPRVPLPIRSINPSSSPAPGATIHPGATPTPPQAGAPTDFPVSTHWIRGAKRALPPHTPKLSQFLMKSGRGRYAVRQVRQALPADLQTRIAMSKRRPMDASGGTIYLTGDGTNYYENDTTLQYGALVYLLCDNVNAPNGNNYYYAVYPPDGSGPFYLNTGINGGTCNTYGFFNLSTTAGMNSLLSSTGSDPSYPGVWTIALTNSTSGTGTYYTESNIIANGSVSFTTYSDLAETHQAIQFTPGSYIVAGATGLNPGHTYAFGWVYTGSGAKCVDAVPALTSYTNVNGTCFTGTTPTGTAPFAGAFSGSWVTTGASTGAYDVELYDVASGDYIGHQQVSIAPSSASWTLTPFNGATNGTNLNNIFATDGLQDQSVTGLKFAVSGLPTGDNGDTIALTVSDPNGVVLMGTVGTATCQCNPGIAGPLTTTQSGGGVSYTYTFPSSTGWDQALGPTQTPFAPNVFTAQLYDQTKGTVLSSYAFQVYGYEGQFGWNDGKAADNASATGTNLTFTFTNNGGNSLGVWNEDNITGLKITPDSGGESLALSSASATDSAGNTWTISQSGAGTTAVITAVPTVAGTSLPVGGTLSFTVKVTVPATKCTTSTCYLTTTILPQHGINYSATTLTNGLGVLSTTATSPAPSIAWNVISESSTGAKMYDRLTPFDQLTYIAGTNNASSSDTYSLKLTVNNTSTSKITDILLQFPSSVDLNANPPASPTATGTTNNTRWRWQTNVIGGALANYSPNYIELYCSSGGCGINAGATATFTFNMPIFLTSFGVQDIPATANWNGTSFTLGGDGTTSTMIAGGTSGTNVDSTALGAASLNPNYMQAYFSPATIGAVAGASTNFVYTNVSLTSDPNPDYVDEINLTFPSAAVNPSSITVPSGWVATKDSGNALHWVIAGCSYTSGTKPINSTPCSTSESSYALGPSGSINIQLNYSSAPTAGTYNVGWWVMGQGGADTSWANSTAALTVSTTSATNQFTNIAGTAFSGSTQPTVGYDASTSGNSYTYVITNTGSVNITGSTVTIPYQTTSSVSAQDTGGQAWQITSAPTVTLSSGSSGTNTTCSGTLAAGQYANPNIGTSTPGYIKLSGCTLKPGGTATITFNAIAPYMLNSVFLFPATVTGGATVSANPSYPVGDSVQVILNGGLTIRTPSLGWVNAGNKLTAASGSSATPNTVCTSCQVLTGTPNIIDFGANITGTFTATDIVDASVTSDASDTNSWALYMSTNTNPLGGTSNPELYTDVDSANSDKPSGFTPITTSFTSVSTASGSAGTEMSTYSGNARHSPLDTILNYQLNTAGSTTSHTVTITFTLVFN